MPPRINSHVFYLLIPSLKLAPQKCNDFLKMGERRREGMQKHKIWQKIIFQSAQEYSDYSQDFAFSKTSQSNEQKNKTCFSL